MMLPCSLHPERFIAVTTSQTYSSPTCPVINNARANLLSRIEHNCLVGSGQRSLYSSLAFCLQWDLPVIRLIKEHDCNKSILWKCPSPTETICPTLNHNILISCRPFELNNQLLYLCTKSSRQRVVWERDKTWNLHTFQSIVWKMQEAGSCSLPKDKIGIVIGMWNDCQ